jgi:pyrroloquinoline quinone biosynthesis protein E
VTGARSLLCELTYRCNLQCPYCFNPVNLGRASEELDLPAWLRVVDEAAALGVVQFGFSGGEPTLRRHELCALISRATQLGGYTNLITQGTFLDEAFLDELLAAGLAHVQISFQGPESELAAQIAGTDVFERKLAALRMVAARDVALTFNYVVHRLNHHTIEEIIALAEREGIRRLELANVQFYGWALRNRAALMPSREQVVEGERIVSAAQERLRGRMDITYVLPDYFEERPKPCMHGWARLAMTVTPDGKILPCPAAATIPTLTFPNVRTSSLADAWNSSPAFEVYRGTAWMPDPCRSCERKEQDWGGCRCQAFLLTGDAGATDPACALSPRHDLIVALRDEPKKAFQPRRAVAP